MIQTHSMILWAKASEENFDVAAQRAYRVLATLKEFGTQLSPNYLTAARKKDAPIFDGTYESLKALLLKRVNKEGNTEFPELGYGIGFFSSHDSKNSSGIHIQVGVTHPQFKNTVLVHLPEALPVFNDSTVAEKLVEVFRKCAEVFDPFWGCVSNSVNADRFNGYWHERLPTATHWVNFFGSDIVNQMGISKIEQAPVQKVEKVGNGYLVMLKESPIDDKNEFDIKIQNKANSYFGF